jgi:Mannosyl-glycoprotein endo-beta-N-acetylglucosaminidase
MQKKTVALVAIVGVAMLAGVLVWTGIWPDPFHSFDIIATTLSATVNPQRQRALDDVAAIAAKIEGESGFPAEAMVAQWAIESEWGQKPVCTNNYFGIKLAARHQSGCSHETTELMSERRIAIWNEDHPDHLITKGQKYREGYYVQVNQKFADYHSLEESCRDYATLITTVPIYAEAWHSYQNSKDVRSLLRGLAGIYWTDPEYVSKALAVMAQLDVKESLTYARNRNAPSPPWSPTRGIPPLGFAAICVTVGNVILGLVVAWFRQRRRAEEEELRRRLREIQADLQVRMAETETRLQDRTRDTLVDALRTNNIDLLDKFNGRYVKRERFDEAHDQQSKQNEEILAEIRALKPPVEQIAKTIPTVRLGG